MAFDPKLIAQLQRARDNASTAAKAAGEELDAVSRLYVAAGADSTARAALKPQVERAIKAYEGLTAQTVALVAMLNELEA